MPKDEKVIVQADVTETMDFGERRYIVRFKEEKTRTEAMNYVMDNAKGGIKEFSLHTEEEVKKMQKEGC